VGKKIVTAIQIAYEGNIDKDTLKRMLVEYKPKGNVIPDIITKHYRRLDFGQLKGVRIVRIATHPEFQGRGFGSKALELLSKDLESRGFHWIGTGFGVTKELLNFWLKNGFIPVHISPEKNPATGEYSVVVIKPLSEKAKKILEEVNFEFKWKFLNAVTDVFFDLDPQIIVMLMKSPFKYNLEKKGIKLFTPVQLDRLKLYVDGPMTYEAAADLVRLLTIKHLIEKKIELDEKDEELLVAKSLLAWSWKKMSDYYDEKKSKLRNKVRKICKTLYKEYIKPKLKKKE